MKCSGRLRVIGLMVAFCWSGVLLTAASMQLPPPEKSGGKPLMEALSLRHSSRQFADRSLSPQVLSNLLWAAFGINREDGHRTAPSSNNWQEIAIYVALPDGIYLYNAKNHALDLVKSGDHRAATGTQDYVAQAAVNLVYIADFGRIENVAQEQMEFYSAANTGFIGQNVYLFCASEGLNSVIRGSVDREKLGALLELRPNQKINLAQSIGYPK